MLPRCTRLNAQDALLVLSIGSAGIASTIMTMSVCGRSKMASNETTIERQLRDALSQLLAEVLLAGFDTATDYNWPKAIQDAREALIAASIANRESATWTGSIMSKSESPPTARELISNIAEAEAYMTGFVDGTLVALRLRPEDTNLIRSRCARMREFTDE